MHPFQSSIVGNCTYFLELYLLMTNGLAWPLWILVTQGLLRSLLSHSLVCDCTATVSIGYISASLQVELTELYSSLFCLHSNFVNTVPFITFIECHIFWSTSVYHPDSQLYPQFKFPALIQKMEMTCLYSIIYRELSPWAPLLLSSSLSATFGIRREPEPKSYKSESCKFISTCIQCK